MQRKQNVTCITCSFSFRYIWYAACGAFATLTLFVHMRIWHLGQNLSFNYATIFPLLMDSYLIVKPTVLESFFFAIILLSLNSLEATNHYGWAILPNQNFVFFHCPASFPHVHHLSQVEKSKRCSLVLSATPLAFTIYHFGQ